MATIEHFAVYASDTNALKDFYVEALPGLLERYDASRARFSTYLYGAFLRFARPRVVRSLRWKQLLVPLD